MSENLFRDSQVVREAEDIISHAFRKNLLLERKQKANRYLTWGLRALIVGGVVGLFSLTPNSEGVGGNESIQAIERDFMELETRFSRSTRGLMDSVSSAGGSASISDQIVRTVMFRP